MAFECGQSTVDANPGRGGRGAQCMSDVGVLHVLDDAQAHGFTLVCRQHVEQLVGSVAPSAVRYLVLDMLRAVELRLQP
jgi:hypothetical protein